ncbi:MAG: flagellar biosynthetic protein FliO, partial [Pseudomonadota bacterium]
FQIGMGHIGQGDEPITFLRSLPIGPRERLALVACRGNIYLLGITAAGIALIDKWADGEDHQMPDPKMEMEPPKDADTP